MNVARLLMIDIADISLFLFSPRTTLLVKLGHRIESIIFM